MNSIDWVLIVVLCIAFGVGYWLVGRLFTKYQSPSPPADSAQPTEATPDQDLAAPPPPPSPLSKYQNAKRFGWDDRNKPKR